MDRIGCIQDILERSLGYMMYLQLRHHGCEHLERSLGLHTEHFGTVLRLHDSWNGPQVREHVERS